MGVLWVFLFGFLCLCFFFFFLNSKHSTKFSRKIVQRTKSLFITTLQESPQACTKNGAGFQLEQRILGAVPPRSYNYNDIFKNALRALWTGEYCTKQRYCCIIRILAIKQSMHLLHNKHNRLKIF